MSNIVAPSVVLDRHLIQCAGVAFALAAVFTVASMPKPDTAAAGTTDSGAKAPCLQACCLQAQTWPYYERSCLRDSRQDDGHVRTVRVIALNGQVRHHVSRQ